MKVDERLPRVHERILVVERNELERRPCCAERCARVAEGERELLYPQHDVIAPRGERGGLPCELERVLETLELLGDLRAAQREIVSGQRQRGFASVRGVADTGRELPIDEV